MEPRVALIFIFAALLSFSLGTIMAETRHRDCEIIGHLSSDSLHSKESLLKILKYSHEHEVIISNDIILICQEKNLLYFAWTCTAFLMVFIGCELLSSLSQPESE